MKKVFLLLLGILLCYPILLPAQHRKFRVLTYNVENLFDTCHDARHDDYEFLPDSERAWGSMRYWKKQGDISRTIAAASGASPIDLVALCEIENDTVIRDLTQRTRLHRMGYEYLVTHSDDARGVDVALLYQPDRFRLLLDSSLRISPSAAYGRFTRDILYVSGRLPNADTLDVFVNHWPSRRGGTVADDFRWQVARFLKTFADSLMQVRRHPNLIFVGDFNDEYDDRSIADGLGAVSREGKNGSYVVLSSELREDRGIEGTYKFRGDWNQLDQIIVSRAMLEPTNKIHTTSDGCRILALPFLLKEDESRGGVKLNRTYLGPVYQGGVSDHLPLILDLEW